MALDPPHKITRVIGLPQREERRIRDFLQGAVYCWCKNKPKDWFALRDLMGRENFDWGATPMQVLYDRHVNRGKDPVALAARDAGRILKAVIESDSRIFHWRKGFRTLEYLWVP